MSEGKEEHGLIVTTPTGRETHFARLLRANAGGFLEGDAVDFWRPDPSDPDAPAVHAGSGVIETVLSLWVRVGDEEIVFERRSDPMTARVRYVSKDGVELRVSERGLTDITAAVRGSMSIASRVDAVQGAVDQIVSGQMSPPPQPRADHYGRRTVEAIRSRKRRVRR